MVSLNFVLYMLALQVSLAMAGVGLVEGLRRPCGTLGRWMALIVMAALMGLNAAVYPLRPSLGERGVLILILTAGWALQWLVSPLLARVLRKYGPWRALALTPAFYMIFLHLHLMMQSTLFFGLDFAAKGTAPPVPGDWLATVMGLNLLAGAMLLMGALAGVIPGKMSPVTSLEDFEATTCDDAQGDAFHGDEAQGRLAETIRFFLLLIFIRIFATAFSLVSCAFFNPLGARFFFNSLLNHDVSLLILRVLMGMILPGLYALVGLSEIRDGRQPLSAWVFVPLVLFVIVGELIALALTVGMWGIAF